MMLASFSLFFSMEIHAQECQNCEEDPSMCPPGCSGGFEDEALPPSEGYICGDDSCDINEDCGVCPEDCGICEGEEIISEECTESWTCSPWSDCVGGQQTRSCSDSNNCGTYNNKPDELRTCSEEELGNTTGTENISLEVNQTSFDNLTNISGSKKVNESPQISNETEELKILGEKDGEGLGEEVEKTQISGRRGMLNYVFNKNILFFIFFTIVVFIFVIIFASGKKRREKIKKIKSELIKNSGIDENLFNQLVVYIKRHLDTSLDIKIIRRKLIEAGHDVYTVEKIIEYAKKSK